MTVTMARIDELRQDVEVEIYKERQERRHAEELLAELRTAPISRAGDVGMMYRSAHARAEHIARNVKYLEDVIDSMLRMWAAQGFREVPLA